MFIVKYYDYFYYANMITEKRKFGDVGELIAEKFLINKGYIIIDKDFYTKFGEIDIICFKLKNNVKELFFVEVKTRSKFENNNYPEDAVDYFKKIKMDRAAQIYLNKNKILKVFYSFSCIAIIIDKINKKANIKFFEKI